MKKTFFKSLSVYTIVALVTMSFNFIKVDTAQALHPFSGGDGSELSPYEITTIEELNAVRDYMDDNFILMNDLDLYDATREGGDFWNDGAGWEPIGNDINKFTGNFDGDGHTISNLFINRESTQYQSLFGYAYDTAVIENLGVININVTGSHSVGGLVGYGHGATTINNCYSTGVVVGNGVRTGGLVGWLTQDGVINNSYSTATVSGTTAVGGLVGYALGTISNSFSKGDVTRSSGTSTDIGGFVGYTSAARTITNSYSIGSVSYVGEDPVIQTDKGFSGSTGSFSNCFWNTETSGANSTGGYAGVTGKTTAEMRQLATFTDAGWTFPPAADHIWHIDEQGDPGDNDGYPSLEWQGLKHTLAPLTYSVTYNANEATSGDSPDEQTKTESVDLTLASNTGNLQRTNYTFSGWNTQADGNGIDYEESANYTENASVTLYAKWIINDYDVTFNSNGGSGTMDVQTITFGTSDNLIANEFTRTGYAFAGWDTEAGGGGTAYADGESFTMDVEGITLYAQWAINEYTITFDSVGGSAVEAITQDYETEITPPADPTKTGYTFIGWDPEVPDTMPVDGITLIAQWEAVPSSSGGAPLFFLNQFMSPESSPKESPTGSPEPPQEGSSEKSPPFKDISEHWGEEYAEELHEKCGILGYSDEEGNLLNLFGPNDPITRAELVKMMTECEGEEIGEYEQESFPDVKKGKWYFNTVEYAREQGWVEGYEDGTFRPGNKITRAEALKVILLANYLEEEIVEGEMNFVDAKQGEWYSGYLSFAVNKGYVTGYSDSAGELTGYFGPSNFLTRAEAAKIIVEMF